MSEHQSHYIIGITSIGSGVGQSAVNSCRFSSLPLHLVGMGANPMAFGAYDCDLSEELPGIYHPEYIEALLRLCEKHKVQMIIPGLDDELLMIAAVKHRFEAIGCKPLVASPLILEYCRNKEKMSNELNLIANVFVRSYEKESLLTAYEQGKLSFPLIAKPRSGFASRGIFILHNETDFEKLTEDLVIQEIAVPHPQDPNHKAYTEGLKVGKIAQVSEVSIQYVVGRNGNLLGKCATYNKLNNGVPIEIIPYDDAKMWEQLDPLINFFISKGLVGPINIQGRKTAQGYKYFEMNARFTGITGLRAMMGFNEVEALIKNFLDIKPAVALVLNKHRLGIRQVSDRVIQAGKYDSLDRHALLHGYELAKEHKQPILLTGITGFLGHQVAIDLLNNDGFRIFALVRDKSKLDESLIHLSDRIVFCEKTDFEHGIINFSQMDTLIHCAFGRTKDGEAAIASGLELTSWLFSRAIKYQIPAIINMSTQAVYGLKQKPMWNETHHAAPETPYAASKYASELLLQQLASQSKQTRFTSLRLSALFGPGYAMKTNELAGVFIKKATEDQTIEIKGGHQRFDLLDVRDASKAIIALLETQEKWQYYYNLGSGQQIGIQQLAKTAFQAISKPAKIKLSEDPSMNLAFGMDISQFSGLTGWKPCITAEQSMKDMAAQLLKF
jgi:nucleoside-diphosphate-sugar epimerase